MLALYTSWNQLASLIAFLNGLTSVINQKKFQNETCSHNPIVFTSYMYNGKGSRKEIGDGCTQAFAQWVKYTYTESRFKIKRPAYNCPGKQNLRAACPNGKLEFKLLLKIGLLNHFSWVLFFSWNIFTLTQAFFTPQLLHLSLKTNFSQFQFSLKKGA